MVNNDHIREREARGKTIKGVAQQRKDTARSRIFNLFLSEDLWSIWNTVLYEDIVPNISDWIIELISLMLPNGRRRNSSGEGRRASGQVDYTSYSKPSKTSRTSYTENRSRERRRYKTCNDVMNVVFETRADAESVLTDLNYWANRYGLATVKDFFSSAGLSDNGNYQNDDFGWYKEDIRQGYVSFRRGSFIVQLPPPVELED